MLATTGEKRREQVPCEVQYGVRALRARKDRGERYFACREPAQAPGRTGVTCWWMAYQDVRSQDLTPPWHTLILVCSKCGAARHGPDGSEIRKCLKKRLGKPKGLRILEVDCLKLCPDDGVALLSVAAKDLSGTSQTALSVVRSHAEVEELADALRGETAEQDRTGD
jgi:ribosomal protein L40E